MLFFDETDYTAVYFDIETMAVVMTADRENDFLSASERKVLHGIRAPNYRRSWFGGRLCTKILWFREGGHALSDSMSFDDSFDPGIWKEIDIVSRNAEKKGIRPILHVGGEQIDRDVSISHSDSAVFVMLAKAPDIRVGCDIVPVGSITQGVVDRFFTEEESAAAASLPCDLSDRIWAVKETAYKAGNEYYPFAPIKWRVSVRESNLFTCRSPDFKDFSVRTFLHDNHVVAVTSAFMR